MLGFCYFHKHIQKPSSPFCDVVDFYFDNALKVIPTISDPQLFDFVFVDGEKRSYWDFWKAIQSRLAPNAVVVFDDVIAFPENRL